MIPNCTAQKMKFSIKDFFWKCDQIRGKLWIWSHLLKKSLMKNFIFCAWRKVSKTSSYKHQLTSQFLSVNAHCVKSVQIRSFFGSYFPVFGLNTEIYGVNMDQKKTGKTLYLNNLHTVKLCNFFFFQYLWTDQDQIIKAIKVCMFKTWALNKKSITKLPQVRHSFAQWNYKPYAIL